MTRTTPTTTLQSPPQRHPVRAQQPGGFGPADLEGLPAPVRRYLVASIAPGTAPARTARLTMRGKIRIGRWLPFRAHELLTPLDGFVWSARAAGVILGSDSYVNGVGTADWRLAGLLPVMRATGSDTSRSAAGRAGAEGIWVPTALLPRHGVRWTAEGWNRITARFPRGRFRCSCACDWTKTAASRPSCSTAGATPTTRASGRGTLRRRDHRPPQLRRCHGPLRRPDRLVLRDQPLE